MGNDRTALLILGWFAVSCILGLTAVQLMDIHRDIMFHRDNTAILMRLSVYHAKQQLFTQ